MFKTTDTNTLKQDKKCQPCWYIVLSSMFGSTTITNGIIASLKIGAKTIGLTGERGGKLAEVADITLKVPSQNTQRVQECHIMVGHIICDIVEKNLDQKFKS